MQGILGCYFRIPDRIAHPAEIICRSIPEFVAGGAGTFAGNTIILSVLNITVRLKYSLILFSSRGELSL